MDRIHYLEKCLSQDLKPEPYFTQAKRILSDLPQLSHGILEYRLSPEDPRMDLMLQARASEQELGSLTDAYRLPGSTQTEEHLSANRLIQRIAETWGNKKQYLHGILSNVYLVYDLLPQIDVFSVPWMYCSFHNLPFLNPIRYSLFTQTIDLLSLSFSPVVLEKLNLCFQQLDSPAWIFGFGGMYPRKNNALRIGIAGFSSIEQIHTFLEKIHWKGNIRELVKQSSWLTDQVSSLVLALDISEEFQTKIGIECEFLRPKNREQAIPVFQELVSRGLCSAPRAKSILDWVGTDPLPSQQGLMERWINHVKIIYPSSAVIQTKGYLYYQFRPIKST